MSTVYIVKNRNLNELDLENKSDNKFLFGDIDIGSSDDDSGDDDNGSDISEYEHIEDEPEEVEHPTPLEQQPTPLEEQPTPLEQQPTPLEQQPTPLKEPENDGGDENSGHTTQDIAEQPQPDEKVSVEDIGNRDKKLMELEGLLNHNRGKVVENFKNIQQMNNNSFNKILKNYEKYYEHLVKEGEEKKKAYNLILEHLDKLLEETSPTSSEFSKIKQDSIDVQRKIKFLDMKISNLISKKE